MNRNVNGLVKELIIPGKSFNLKLHEFIKSLFIEEKTSQLMKKIIIKDHYYRGYNLVAEEKINGNSLIAQIPFNYCIHSVDIENFGNSKHLKSHIFEISDKIIGKNNEEMYNNLCNHLTLIYKSLIFLQNKSSNLNSFVELFPKQINSLVNVNEKNKSLIDGVSLKIAIDKYFFYILTINNYIQTNEVFKINEDLFHYLFCITNSKKMYFETEKGKTQCIIPLFEILKHSFKPNCTIKIEWDSSVNKTMCNLYSIKDIIPGDSLSVCYDNSITNTELALKYGFVDKNNPNKNIEIPLVLGLNEANQIFKNKIDSNFFSMLQIINANTDKKNLLIEKMNKLYHLDLPFKFSNENLIMSMLLYENKFDKLFMTILRIGFLDEIELNNCLNSNSTHNFDNLYSQKNEQKSYIYLTYLLNGYLSKFNNQKNESSENLILNNDYLKTICDKDSNDFYLIKILENEEKSILKKNLEYLSKKLNTI